MDLLKIQPHIQSSCKAGENVEANWGENGIFLEDVRYSPTRNILSMLSYICNIPKSPDVK